MMSQHFTVKPRYNEGPMDWQGMFVINSQLSLLRTPSGPRFSVREERDSLQNGCEEKFLDIGGIIFIYIVHCLQNQIANAVFAYK